jgi:UDP-N-acetylmuramoyl-tripeptide--D-alanyl-D-alanine ligase
MNPEFPADRLAAWTGGRWTRPPAASPTGFSIDSRAIRPGQMFVAIRTEARDGHGYVAAAAAAGASAALVSGPVKGLDFPQLVVADTVAAFQAIARAHRRGFPGTVIGVTGSAGKTSTKNLLAILLGGAEVLSTKGNLNNHLGVPLTLTRLDPRLQRHAVVEAGIGGPGEMASLASMIAPDIAIITLVAPAHLSGLGSLEGVAREKAGLAAAVREGGLALFPASCLEFAAFRDLKTRSVVVVRGPGGVPPGQGRTAAHFTIEPGFESTRLTLSHKSPPTAFFLRSASEGMAQNAALALCAGLELGIAPEVLQARLAAWHPASLRGDLRRIGDKLYYLDCYNANPASMADALEAFGCVAPAAEPRLYVIGGMEELGADSARYHSALGRSIRLRPKDFLFIIGDHAPEVCAGALAGGADPDQVRVVESLGPVSERLAGFRGAVFVKGSRRHELERLLEGAAGVGLPMESHA